MTEKQKIIHYKTEIVFNPLCAESLPGEGRFVVLRWQGDLMPHTGGIVSEVSENQSGLILLHGKTTDCYREKINCKNGIEWAYWPKTNEVTTYAILVEKVKWNSVDPLLGTMSDYDLAIKAGCSHCTIFQRRVKLGISPYLDRPKLIKWENFENLLGTMNDSDLAKKIGCKETAVRRRRKKLGIQRALGDSQQEVLRTLCRRPGWAYKRSREIGWVYGTESRTRKILDGLCLRGLVELKGDEYHPTQAGMDLLSGQRHAPSLSLGEL